MIEFEKIWVEQCDAARGIKEEFGTETALGYLIGEKLVNFVRAANTHPEFTRELPNFVAEVKVIFLPSELRLYFDTVNRVGPEGHAMTDEQYRLMRDAGAIDTSVVRGAEDVIVVARVREMLLEDSAN